MSYKKIKRQYRSLERISKKSGVNIDSVVNTYINKVRCYVDRDFQKTKPYHVGVDLFDVKGLYGDRAVSVMKEYVKRNY